MKRTIKLFLAIKTYILLSKLTHKNKDFSEDKFYVVSDNQMLMSKAQQDLGEIAAEAVCRTKKNNTDYLGLLAFVMGIIQFIETAASKIPKRDRSPDVLKREISKRGATLGAIMGMCHTAAMIPIPKEKDQFIESLHTVDDTVAQKIFARYLNSEIFTKSKNYSIGATEEKQVEVTAEEIIRLSDVLLGADPVMPSVTASALRAVADSMDMTNGLLVSDYMGKKGDGKNDVEKFLDQELNALEKRCKLLVQSLRPLQLSLNVENPEDLPKILLKMVSMEIMKMEMD